jgi:glycosyltransferase involved in cell wall biosynthesis
MLAEIENWTLRRFLSGHDRGWQALSYAQGFVSGYYSASGARTYSGRPPESPVRQRREGLRIGIYCGQLQCGGSDRTSILLAAYLDLDVVGLCNRTPGPVYEPFRSFLSEHNRRYFESRIPDCNVLIASGPAPARSELPAGLRAVLFFVNAPTEACENDRASWEALGIPNLGYVNAAFSLPGNRGPVVWNGAEASQFMPCRDRQGIAYLGRYAWEKNLYSLVAAASQFSMQVDLYGEGSEREGLIDAATKWCAFNVNVHAPTDAAEVLRTHDALILPSVLEASPSVIAEAMLAGAIVIATPAGDVPALIGDGRGILTVGFGPESIADAIQCYCGLEDDEKEAMRKRAHDFALQHLTAKRMSEGFASAVENLCQN